MRHSLYLCIGFVTLVSLIGCGRETAYDGPAMVPVTGTVTLDGEPVEGAHVRFSPQTVGRAAFAVTDERGRYELRNLMGEGAVPGKYGISVIKEVQEKGMEFDSQAEMEAYVREQGKPPGTEPTNVLPEKYASKQTSGLTAEVTAAKKNHFDLKLESTDEE